MSGFATIWYWISATNWGVGSYEQYAKNTLIFNVKRWPKVTNAKSFRENEEFCVIIVPHQPPLWWLFFVLSKKCVIFVVLCTWCGHYILKVFSLSYKKMWKFSRTRDERITLTICLFMAGNALVFRCVLSPYHSGVGISIVYFCSGFSTTFL